MNKTITNEVSSKGLLVCVVCNQPSTWHPAKDVTLTSPMRRVKVRNLDALVHECCLKQLYSDIERQLRRALLKSQVRDMARASGRFAYNTGKLLFLLATFPVWWAAARMRRARRQREII